MKYRAQIAEFVPAVVVATMDKATAGRWIVSRAPGTVAPGDHARFVEAVETELTNLHEGNMAHYRIRPSEYYAWRTTWM